MTPSLQIVVVHEPPRQGVPLSQDRPDRYNRFLDVLGTFAGIQVTVARLALVDAAREFRAAYFLLSSPRYPDDALAPCSAADRRHVAARLIALDLTAPRLGTFLESHAMLAGIEPGALHAWLRADWRNEPNVGALYGLARIGAAIGARCYPDAAVHYCRIEGPLHEGGLPHLLVDYVRAHARREHRAPAPSAI